MEDKHKQTMEEKNKESTDEVKQEETEAQVDETAEQRYEEPAEVEDDVADLVEETEEVTEEAKTDKEDNVASFQAEIESLKEQLDKLENRLLRTQAEYDNYRKRTDKERVQARKYEAQALATELLPVIDNFERALQTEVDESNKGFYDGVQMVYEQLLQALASQGVEVMDVVNKPFDPNLHHAVMQEEDETIDSNIITEELQKGYMLKDKVIRPAMVKVNK